MMTQYQAYLKFKILESDRRYLLFIREENIIKKKFSVYIIDIIDIFGGVLYMVTMVTSFVHAYELRSFQ